MKLPRRRFLQLAAGVAALPAVSRLASAQAYPSKPITIVVPYAAGGPTDTIGRVLAERMRSSLGQTVIIENTTGAGGTIAVGRVARAAPDGYTIGIGQNGSHVVTGATYTRLPYDLLNDFEPLTLLTDAPFFLAGKKTMPADDLKSLIAWFKANPHKATLGNGGNGSISHICGLLFLELTGTRAQVVPYRGGAPVAVAIASGDVPLGVVDTAAILPMIRSGQVLALGVAEPVRAQSMPDIPTLREVGVPNFSAPSWLALFAPRGTPQDRIAKLNAEIARIMAMTEAQRVLFAAGLEPATNSPSEMRRIIEADYKKWGQLIAASGLKAE